MKIGDRVHYIPFEGCDESQYENGIIRSFPRIGYAYVVYKCNNDWDNYMDYTSNITDIDFLREGWINDQFEGW